MVAHIALQVHISMYMEHRRYVECTRQEHCGNMNSKDAAVLGQDRHVVPRCNTSAIIWSSRPCYSCSMSVPTGGRRGHMSVDLGALRQQLDAYCRVHQTTPSVVVRRAVADVLAGGAPATDSAIAPYPITPTIEGTERLVLRLTASERKALSEVAEKAGFKTTQRWIIAALRIYLTGKPHFSDSDMSVLADSNFQLAAIGRNLNQIAKRLNSEPDVSGYRLDVIEDMTKRIRQHTELVSSLLQMNIERWKIGGGNGR